MPHNRSRNDTHHTEGTRRNSRSGFGDDNLSGPFGHDMLAAADAIRSPISDLRSTGVRAGLQMQTEMLGAFEEIGRDWMSCAASQAELAFELPSRLTEVRTVPDAIDAYQAWLGEWLALRGEASRRLILDGQKFVNPGVRYVTRVVPAMPA
ncbi:MAG: hypothetical protein KGK33_15785 [Hyphomicrobiales bacterium]|nr:hypothetical protein [Hyphomicrobiales bacterium]MDE2286071.1 hypothetical protein [Hyphomicrobiales bacterium]MDE2372729.1 hypothetical protein [Hyphomicrobiales bacterium]